MVRGRYDILVNADSLSFGISEQYVCNLIRIILLINHFYLSVELVIAVGIGYIKVTNRIAELTWIHR